MRRCVRHRHKTSRSTRRRGAGARHFTFSYEFETLAEGALFELYIDNNQLATHDVLARLRVRPTLAWLWRDAAMGVSDAPPVRLVV